MAKTVYIYTGNHASQQGIEEYIACIKNIFCGENMARVETTKNLNPNGTNIIIDEFTSYFTNSLIREFRSENPNVPLILVLTEFVEKKYGNKSFNHFGFSPARSFIRVLFSVFARIKRPDYGSNSLVDYLKLVPLGIAGSVEILAQFCISQIREIRLISPIGWFKKEFNSDLYFTARWLGFTSLAASVDAYIASHEEIFKGCEKHSILGKEDKRLGVLYPLLDKEKILDGLCVEKELFIEVTGTITPYRKKWMRKIDKLISILDGGRHFGRCKSLSFSAAKKNQKRGAFSLHPPQEKKWPYSSPTRIYRALSHDHSVPVLTTFFGQNPIEDVCFKLNDEVGNEEWSPKVVTEHLKRFYMYYNEEKQLTLRREIGRRIDEYNKIAEEGNRPIAAQVLSLNSK